MIRAILRKVDSLFYVTKKTTTIRVKRIYDMTPEQAVIDPHTPQVITNVTPLRSAQ